ncbi:MAG: Holliday junction resolvase RuvX [Rhodobacteraceae bacterium]|nr:Holliday junction resolvase RuvX [Paracoccaceae bacterium]MCY4250781.1 Holliday junction resolvase RuvX [Paracoccaceae bacterium]MCY4307219.1 Holliday junction resolvase RuvX [Paracoccaceae bacterium]
MIASDKNLNVSGVSINSPYASTVEFVNALMPGKPIAALDVGTKTIGLAISDTNLMIATPLETLQRTKFKNDMDKLLSLESYWDLAGYVIGLPMNMDGSEGPRCQSVRAFARNMCQYISLPITFWDERLSTVSAEKYLLETGASRKKRAAKKDNFASSIILQTALEYFQNKKVL